MAISMLQGSLKYDFDRKADGSGDGMRVPIVLQNLGTGWTVPVMPSENGDWTIRNVPDGDYQIVEQQGYPVQNVWSSDVDYGSGGSQAPRITEAKLPTVQEYNGQSSPVTIHAPGKTTKGSSNVINGVSETTKLFSVQGSSAVWRTNGEKNTLTSVSSSSGTDIKKFLTILNGPSKNTGFEDELKAQGTTIDSTNLISGGPPGSFSADNGTFGSYPQGTPIDSIMPSPPYYDLKSSFTYIKGYPEDGQYNVENTKAHLGGSFGTWWNLAGHTTGDERDKFAIVNGSNPGQNILSQSVAVEPNTNYLASVWVANMLKTRESNFKLPQGRLEVTDTTDPANPKILYSNNLGTSLEANLEFPEWKQFGDIIRTGGTTRQLSINLISTGPSGDGNDYAIDDVTLRKVQLKDLTNRKSVNKETAAVGETVTYTVHIENTLLKSVNGIRFQDTIPSGLTFVPGSVRIDGAAQTGLDPNAGFDLPFRFNSPGAAGDIAFDAKVDRMPNPNPAPNAASASYTYSFITGNQPVSQTTTSNVVNVTAGTIEVSAAKAADKKSYLPGETATYTITLTNKGTFPVKAPVVADSLPQQLTNPQYAITSPAGASGPWTGSVTLPDIPPGGAAAIRISGTVAARSTGSLPNAATVTSPTLTQTITGKTSDDPINGDPKIIDTADVSTKKAADKKSYLAGETVAYTITVANNGPAAAKAPTITDTPPAQLENLQYSVDGGAQAPWMGSATLADLPNGKTAAIKITGKVRSDATGTLPNTATTTTPTLNKNGKENITTGKTVDDPINGDPIILDRADVSTKKAADKKSYLPGEAITYTITVTNNGPAAAKAPKITDTPPEQIENLQFSVDGGPSAPWTGTAALADMPSGKTAVIKLTGRVKARATGVLPNSATTVTPTLNKDGKENITTGKTVDDPINGDPIIVNTADVTLVKTSDKSLYLPGENVVYTIKLTNNGPGKVDTYNVWDDVPPVITNPKFRTDKALAWDNAGVWKGNATASGLNLSGLEAGKTFEMELSGKLASTAIGSLNNSTTVTSGTFTPEGKQINVTAHTTAKIIDTADVSTKKAADKKSYLPGEAITYTITVTNNGPAAAKVPRITDTLPPQIENPQFSVDGGPSTPWTGPVTLEDLESGKAAVIKITGMVKARATGVLPNSATTVTPTLNKDGKDNTTTGRTVDDPKNGDPFIIDTADVSTKKAADKKNYLPGEGIAYTITVTNNGPSAAKAPRITDALPEQIENPQFSVDGGPPAPWTGTATLADMPSGKVSVIRITGKVKLRATGQRDNNDANLKQGRQGQHDHR